jgi:hypothetical protein
MKIQAARIHQPRWTSVILVASARPLSILLRLLLLLLETPPRAHRALESPRRLGGRDHPVKKSKEREAITGSRKRYD